MANRKMDKQDETTAELTTDLQRVRADFENFRKNVDARLAAARQTGYADAVLSLLPVVDNIERAVSHLPAELADNEWARGVANLGKQLETTLGELGIQRINAQPGTPFNPTFHDAVQFDDSTSGETETIESELQPGYLLNDQPIRHAMVRVTRK
ncbi:MAG: nucleotide exchange factor GrpE [Candidatus Nomurabacteria bacterium]|jgi:molecular chaperone GrpE|nr:nucleotide exchange factor GrpE [Candidatus Nomurabacteria bacterium]